MNLLHLEDQPRDAQLAASHLLAAWPDCRLVVVATGEAFEVELRRGGYDVVLVDFTLPQFDGGRALELARTLAPDVPFILLTGTLSEDAAIDAVAAGATDYVLKDQIKRLVPVIRRALRESAARRDLRQLNLELETRVRERTARLEGAMKELEAFSYSVSHDLRAPLRGIDGFARALLEDCGAQLDAEGHRLLGTIRNETRRMGQLIDDLLAFSRAGRQEIDPSLIDMTELARSAFLNIIEAAPPKVEPVLDLRLLPEASGDRALLRQVFANLLGNAVKFSSRQPAPRIEVTGTSDGTVNTYCIRDNGVGFDPRFAHKLFGVFQRLHRQEEFEGTGVGLALVQRIVQRHDGRVWAEGHPNAGAAFYFSLPVRG